MPKITTYDFIESNTRKTIFLFLLFPISLSILIYLGILYVSLLRLENMPRGAFQVSVFTLANQTAMYVLPIVSIIAILWILVSYYLGQHFILATTKAVELTKQNAPEVVKL
jgi:heat shock protein HtpX